MTKYREMSFNTEAINSKAFKVFALRVIKLHFNYLLSGKEADLKVD